MAMVADPRFEQAEADIRTIVGSAPAPSRPLDLIRRVMEAGVPEYYVRIALWHLIDRHEVELTPDLLLILSRNGHGAEVAAAAST